MTDADIIRRSIGRPAAFEDLFERHFTLIYRYLRRRVGEHTAEDLAAETFVRAFEGRRGYDQARSDARPWLFGIATHVLGAHWKHDSRAAAAVAAAAQPGTALVADHAAASNGRIDAAAAVAKQREALRALPEEQREVLFLVGVAELTYEETATALNIAVGTVRSRLNRARTELLRSVPSEEPAP